MKERLSEILSTAVYYGVTDIHFTSGQDQHITIDMRMGSKMKRLKYSGEDGPLFRYLMYRANLDISDAFMPQTGSFEIEINGMHLSLRFAVVTSCHITSGVLRILNNHPELSIHELTAQPEAEEWLKKITMHRNGLFLLSGPTSSGKTTSLYTILNEAVNKKIFTLEDPIEIVNSKYVQLQINDAQHLSYGEGIKQLMRHDPDIVMIGEIRDEEAAQMAVRCALTGHLVISSIHSQDCASAIIRMRDLGAKEYELKDVLYGVSNQRLYGTDELGRIGIYEIMDRKEVLYYLEHRRTSSTFEDLHTKIAQSIKEGTISAEDAEEELLA